MLCSANSMKKIINGKLYNTDTAERMGTWDNGIYGDLDSVEETLYRKRTGEFFLCGEGGARSRYAISTGNNFWSGGSEIIPLTWEAAREWAEKHLNADNYEQIFGEVSEDDSRTVITLSLSTGAIEKAKRAAAQASMSLSSYIESLIK